VNDILNRHDAVHSDKIELSNSMVKGIRKVEREKTKYVSFS
jgi:hypothetical protein